MARRLDDALAQVRPARELGFSFVTMGQRYLTQPYQMLQTVPVLARVTAEAPEIGLLGIVVLPLHHPVDIAEWFATLDVISRGRLSSAWPWGTGTRSSTPLVWSAAPGRRGSRRR